LQTEIGAAELRARFPIVKMEEFILYIFLLYLKNNFHILREKLGATEKSKKQGIEMDIKVSH